MATKKLFHVTLMVEASDLHEIMSSGAKIMDVRPVKHGGIDEATGEMRSAPTTREFIMAYVAAQKGAQWAVLDLRREGRERGMKPNALGQTVVTLANEGVLKRVSQGVYQERGARQITSRKTRSDRNGHVVTGAGADLVMKLVAKGDIQTAKIKEAFRAAKMSPKSVNNLLGKMQNSGQIKRTAERGVITKGA